MTTSLQISIDDAAVGMALATDLTDSKGNFLLPGKTVLTATMITSLKKHHVTTISVSVENAESEIESAERAKADLKNKTDRLDKMFEAHADDALNQRLKTFLINFYSDANHE